MYSKNDYRYYLERRLAKSDDFLAHYGIKGMKWKKRKKQPSPTTYDPNTGQYTYSNRKTMADVKNDAKAGNYEINRKGLTRQQYEAAMRNRAAKQQTYKITKNGVESRREKTSPAIANQYTNRKAIKQATREGKVRRLKNDITSFITRTPNHKETAKANKAGVSTTKKVLNQNTGKMETRKRSKSEVRMEIEAKKILKEMNANKKKRK